ncbi:tRNA (N(6)-L-threonylcarbamoyladenosine(37)-C(2))-methylthiotransferase [Candidatus Woesearchaeota archaeon]|nr:tRNA (N(6)-L-threonylcarbamoyladenosine(37)-C(2))-methylthiotransferase [Candidatus Woesearchaeota archaeon]
MHKVYIKTRGCSANFSEGEIMAGLLNKAGFKIENSKDRADIIILNVCTVKGENTALRDIRKISGVYPEKKLIIAGCLTRSLIAEIRGITEDASLVSTHNLSRIVEAVEEAINDNIIEIISPGSEKKLKLPKIRKNPVVGIVPILSGCNGECTYCSVRLVKGGLESYPMEQIIEEARSCLRDGCRELWITSQDNAAYGTEKIWRSSLPELLKDILNIEKSFMVRLGMMNPFNLRPILDDMIQIYKHEKVFKFLHLPLQSGNDEILERMGRKYTISEFKDIVNRFRREIPNLNLSTDIIVGFPGETVEQFNNSLDMIKEIRPDILNISRFTARDGTAAADMPDKIHEGAAKDRTRILTGIFQNISRMNNEKWINWQGDILIDEKGKHDSWIGRNFAYKQVIVKGDYGLGQNAGVKVTNITSFDLRAERA